MNPRRLTVFMEGEDSTKGQREVPPNGVGQDLAVLVRDAQAELNDAWPRGAGDGTEAAGKRASASRRTDGLERSA